MLGNERLSAVVDAGTSVLDGALDASVEAAAEHRTGGGSGSEPPDGKAEI